MVFRLLSVFSGLFLGFAAYAQGSPVEGVDYIELKPPQAVESSGKIEVLEFFWYRCPHCYALEPDLEAWAKRLPRDVQFKRLPGILNDDWAVDARIFYTLEAIGELERLHKPFFDTIHQRSEEHTSELQSHLNLVCRLLLEKKKHTNKAECRCTNATSLARAEPKP